uniref:Uncharacterized protein n=1 Tax=Rhizophora mucronata TaxID=61149 RepID=A0A2P2MH40_RHIMU
MLMMMTAAVKQGSQSEWQASFLRLLLLISQHGTTTK